MTRPNPFMRPHLTGERFNGAVIPLEVLADLAVLEEMVVEVAKWRFLQDHSDRQRSPRNFTDGIELKLAGVDDGSAVPVIVLSVASQLLSLFPQENQIYFEQARDSIVGAVWAAGENKNVLEHLPEKCLAYFDRLGRSLRVGEAIEFERGEGVPPARLTRETRERLLAAARMDEVTDEVELRGAVVEFDDDRATFELQLADGRKLSGPVPIQFHEVLLEALRERRNGARVLVQGVGKFDRLRGTQGTARKVQGFASIWHVTPLDPLDVPARIDELRALRDGWLDGYGRAPDVEGLVWFGESFEQRYPDGLPLPHIYPTEEGGVRAEWSVVGSEMSLDVDPRSHAGHWHCWYSDTDSDVSEVLNLDLDIGWTRLAELVSAISAEKLS